MGRAALRLAGVLLAAAAPAFASTPGELRPAEKDLFNVIGVDARLRFERDASGAVAGLVLVQGGREQAGRRVDSPAR